MIAFSAERIARLLGGELDQVAVPDEASAVAAISERLRPGDVVLVKASRAAGLQTVALALTGGDTP